MNFLKIITKIGFIFFGLILLYCIPGYSQRQVNTAESGIPLIQKFTFPNFWLSSEKFSVYEDSSGIFLIGAKDKILVFYGNEFRSLKLKGKINISSNQKAVFFTGYNSIGLIKFFKYGTPQLLKVVDYEANKKESFGQINNVLIADGILVFNNDTKLFQFNDSNYSVIDSSNIKLQLFRVNDTVYTFKHESGLYKFSPEGLVAIKNGEKLAGKNIECILPFENSLLIKISENQSFLKLNDNELTELKFGFESFLDKAGFSDALLLQKNNIVIGTKSAGILIYNFVNKTLRNIGVDKGLLDNTVNNLHVDKAGNLWVLHKNGISRIELNVPVTEYGSFAGISGKVNDIIKYKGTLYLATSTGLFKAGVTNTPLSSDFRQTYFSKVDGIVNECINLQIRKEKLFITTPTGIYLLEGNSAKLVFKSIINCIARENTEINSFFIGNSNGLTKLDFINNEFIISDHNPIDNRNVVEISVEKGGLIWMKTACNKLILLSSAKNHSISDEELNFFDKTSGLPSEIENMHLINTDKGIRFCFPDAVFNFDHQSKKFESIEVTILKHLKGIPWLVETLTDNSGNKWYYLSSSIENLQGVLFYKISADNKFKKPVFFNTGSFMSPIYMDSTTAWIGCLNKLLQFDYRKSYNMPRRYSAIIKRMIIENDSVIQMSLEDPEIHYKHHNIKFEVSSTCFEEEPYVRYQYKLLGYNDSWSSWTRESVFSFNNLSPGTYIFMVRALNVDGTVSDITSLKFLILNPFYSSYPAYALYFIILLLTTFVLMRWRSWRSYKQKEKLEKIVYERTLEIMKEKDKSEQLIANLLPKGTADELKSTGKATSQKFSMVTVLFSDIQGFTKIAEQMNPELLIDQLDAFFFQFDMVVEKYNIEKIKTIGDAYMCAGGIPNKNITNPVEVVLAAIEMQEYMHELKAKNADIWDLRIGIHTGSVIAGVVGHKKMSYDIWGDTVNTASRMESSGEIGKINISGFTYELVKDFFECEHRGKMPVKYKGEINMYFVNGIRPELSEGGQKPNKKFLTKLQLLRLQDIEDEIFEKLEKELPSDLYFHNFSRIKDIYNLVDLFARAEELPEEENLLLRTAALLHDVGLTVQYDNHEDVSIEYAKEILPRYKYSQEQIEKIISLIDVTRQMRKPENKAEEIMLDADMNYLSRADFVTLSDLLYKELSEKGKTGNKSEWDRVQVVILSNHKYYTNVANVLRDVSPTQQIENILEATKKSG